MHRGWGSVGLSVLFSRQNRRAIASRYYNEGWWHSLLLASIRRADGGTGSQREVLGGVGYVGESFNIAQPATYKLNGFEIAVAIDGKILNLSEIASSLGLAETEDKPDTLARVLSVLSREHGGDVVEAVKTLVKTAVGGFSLIAITSEPRLVAAKDAQGFKPLSYATSDSYIAVASETSALQSLGFEWRELDAGSVLSFDGRSLEVSRAEATTATPCAFEYVYLSRPDSVFNNVSVYSAKFNMGREVARRSFVKADIVVPLPESGRVAALGYSRESGIPLEEAVYTVRYTGRSFLAPKEVRDIVADAKYGIVKSVVKDKSIIIVDDSIVRGTTVRRLSLKLRSVGAREIHLRIASPRLAHPCPISSEMKLQDLAARNESLREALAGIASLHHNTIEGLRNAIGLDSLCTACFSGECPLTRGRDLWNRGGGL